jgi:predicted enzyme related to lactoylglutathione lyase
VFVDDTNVAAEKAKSLGAKIAMGPMQVGPGIMAIVEDPEGGHLALWATQNPLGPFLWDEPGALCWNEFVAADVDALTRFYAALFGWKTEKLPVGDFTYTLLKNGDLPIGGVIPKSHALPGAPTSWTAYFRVNDCDATVKKAEKLGARRSSPPRDVPNWGRFSVLGDPEGVSFAIVQKSAPPK